MKDNELIAEFMGVLKLDKDDRKGILWDTSQTGKEVYGLRSEHLRYDSNWDWLMPVVEKIETPDLIKGYNFSVEMLRRLEDNQVTIYSIVRDASFSMVNLWGRDVSKIKAVYKAVVEFIKWYNQNEKF